MNPRRLYRSHDRQLAGVAGGMAEYLNVDPTIIRIGWILVTLVTGGLALIGYLLLALVIPNSPYPAGPGYVGGQWMNQPMSSAWPGQAQYGGQPQSGGQTQYSSPTWSVPPTPSTPQWNPAYVAAQPAPASRGLGAAGIVGILLVVIGGIALADIALPGMRIGLALGPAVILALGIGLLISSIRRPAEEATPAAPAATATDYSAATTPAAASPVPADPVASWSPAPSDLTPWPVGQPVRSAEAPAVQPVDPARSMAIDPDATQTDLPTTAQGGTEPQSGAPA